MHPSEWLLQRATDRLFRHLEVDRAWRRAVEEVARRGPVVYVLRHVSLLDYLALRHLTHRFDLPRIGFVNELPPRLAPLERRSRRAYAGAADHLCATLESGGSAALFVKRPPDWRSPAGGRGRSEGAALLTALIALQKNGGAGVSPREIMLMPQTFVWSLRPERRGFSLVDTFFGPADIPGDLRQLAQFALNYKHGMLRAGEPLSLREFLGQESHDESPERLVRRLTYVLLRKVERERRVIVGPARKAPDRVREDVLKSPKLQEIIGELAGHGGQERALLTHKARTMLRAMQTLPDPEAQRGLELLAEQVLHRVYTAIDVDQRGLERLRELGRDGAVVLLPSHKSHVDYIVLTYVLRKNAIQIPVIAAGDNLAFFPAGPILRRAGAFFIRRSFRGDRLYTAVVDAYLRRLLRDGWMVEFFLEGGRSRTGKLLPPMLGLLNMVVSSALSLGKPVYCQPVAIGYERLMEEGAFARELSGGEKLPEDASALLKLGGVLRERWGRIDIQFGEPIELGALCRSMRAEPDALTPARRRALVKRLAHRAMDEINRVTAITPGSLVALCLLSHGRRGVAYRELVVRCQRLTAMLIRAGARPSRSLAQPGGTFREAGLRDALTLYLRSGLCEQHVMGDSLASEPRKGSLSTHGDTIFIVPHRRRMRLDLAKNHIVNWFVDRALVAVALCSRGDVEGERQAASPAAAMALDDLKSRVQSLSRLFKYEFMFRADAPFDAIFDDVCRRMAADGEITLDDASVAPGLGHDDLDGHSWLGFYGNVVRNFLEGYRIAARALTLLRKGNLDDKELVVRALRIGQRMFLEGDIERSEAVSRPLIENALKAFLDQGYLVRGRRGLTLADSFQSDGAAATIEARVAGFLGHDGPRA
jgi:glycerol-3-phosphate O-acyltransferase